MAVPDLTKDDIIEILKNDYNIIDIGPQIKGGQKAVVPIITKDKKYAVKFIELSESDAFSFGEDDENIEDATFGRLKREIEILYNSDCPNVVKVFSNNLNFIEYKKHKLYFYIEEFIDGVDIFKLLQQHYTFSIDEIFNLAFCINRAIACLWSKKVIHRDIKPQNIIYDKERNRFVLIDPGVALDLTDISFTQPGQIVGTQIYMSPEQFQVSRKRDLDFRSDHFLLGICLYILATTKHPFFTNAKSIQDIQYNIIHNKHKAIQEYNPDFPVCLSAIIDRLLSKETFKRYRTTDLLEKDLIEAQGEYYGSIHST